MVNMNILLLGYYGLSAIYLFLYGVLHKRNIGFAVLLVGLLPFFGLLLSVVHWVSSTHVAENTDRFEALIEEHGENERIFQGVDVNKELNMIPLEEALLVNDFTVRRRQLLDVLKEDLDEELLPLLETAVSNSDTETSHYAVTAVVEIKRKLFLEIQKWSVKYEQHKDNPDVLRSYAEAIKQYMNSGFMDQRTYRTYGLTYAKLLDALLHSDARDSNLFMKKIHCELELGHDVEALHYSQWFIQSYPEDEKAYQALLEIYYKLKMSEPFFEVLAQLKGSKIRVSNDMLNTIRFWSNIGA